MKVVYEKANEQHINKFVIPFDKIQEDSTESAVYTMLDSFVNSALGIIGENTIHYSVTPIEISDTEKAILRNSSDIGVVCSGIYSDEENHSKIAIETPLEYLMTYTFHAGEESFGFILYGEPTIIKAQCDLAGGDPGTVVLYTKKDFELIEKFMD